MAREQLSEAQLDAWFAEHFGDDEGFQAQFTQRVVRSDRNFTVRDAESGEFRSAPEELRQALVSYHGGEFADESLSGMLFSQRQWARLNQSEKQRLHDAWTAFQAGVPTAPPQPPANDLPDGVAIAVDSPAVLAPPVEPRLGTEDLGWTDGATEYAIELGLFDPSQLDATTWDQAFGDSIDTPELQDAMREWLKRIPRQPGQPLDHSAADEALKSLSREHRQQIYDRGFDTSANLTGFGRLDAGGSLWDWVRGHAAWVAVGLVLATGSIVFGFFVVGGGDGHTSDDIATQQEAPGEEPVEQPADESPDPVNEPECPLDDPAACDAWTECTAVGGTDCTEQVACDFALDACSENAGGAGDAGGAGGAAGAVTATGTAIPPDCDAVVETALFPTTQNTAPVTVVVLDDPSSVTSTLEAAFAITVFPALDGPNGRIQPERGADGDKVFRVEIEPGPAPGIPTLEGQFSNTLSGDQEVRIGTEIASTELTADTLTVTGTTTDADGNQGPTTLEVRFETPEAIDLLWWFTADAPPPALGTTVDLSGAPQGDQVAFTATGPPCSEVQFDMFGDGQPADFLVGVTDSAGSFSGQLARPATSSSWDLFAATNGTLVGALNSKD